MNTNTCFSYQFNYEIEKPQYSKDIEPNNDINEALPIVESEIKEGQLGYSSTIGRDDKDVYLIALPQDGQLMVNLKLSNQFSGQSYLLINALNAKGQTIFSKYIYVNAGDTLTDYLNLGCQTSDTIYIQLSTNNCFS